MPPAKQYKIAGETNYIYAPLAHRLGLFRIKNELENLSFKYEHPETYYQIEKNLLSTKKRVICFSKNSRLPSGESLAKWDMNFS